MKKKRTKCLVIDASVLIAAGGTEAKNPTSKRCRDLLMAVLEICHRVLVTPNIKAEWRREDDRLRRNPSRFSLTWTANMNARKKIEWTKTDSPNLELQARVAELAVTRGGKAMLKDLHLVEAALEADKIICSLDEECRRPFSQASANISKLREIIWVNPDLEAETVIAWLERGAPADKKLALGQSIGSRDQNRIKPRA